MQRRAEEDPLAGAMLGMGVAVTTAPMNWCGKNFGRFNVLNLNYQKYIVPAPWVPNLRCTDIPQK